MRPTTTRRANRRQARSAKKQGSLLLARIKCMATLVAIAVGVKTLIMPTAPPQVVVNVTCPTPAPHMGEPGGGSSIVHINSNP